MEGSNFKCHFCKTCNGKGCIGELPGMGGSYESKNFISNCSFWNHFEKNNKELIHSEKFQNLPINRDTLGLAPMTGAEQNMGFAKEDSYYYAMVKCAWENGVSITLGDGEPDYKLKYGIEAVKKLQSDYPEAKASVFIKPYPNEKILERMDWTKGICSGLGIDIDSYNIITMRETAFLEKKNLAKIKEIENKAHDLGVPFIIKGVFTEEDLELVEKAQPDVVYISNHGGRVETRKGSTGQFLLDNIDFFNSSSQALWIDGGIRTSNHIRLALSLGAERVLLGRPFVSALCRNGEQGVKNLLENIRK